jgi:hypothetical protein
MRLFMEAPFWVVGERHHRRSEDPSDNMRLHLCLRASDGILLVDTCPTREVFEAFAASPEFVALRALHGMPEPESVEDHPVALAFVDGVRR